MLNNFHQFDWIDGRGGGVDNFVHLICIVQVAECRGNVHKSLRHNVNNIIAIVFIKISVPQGAPFGGKFGAYGGDRSRSSRRPF